MVVNLMLEDFQYFKNPNVIAIYYGVMIGIMIILSVLQYVCDQKGENPGDGNLCQADGLKKN
jgi:hypothetical protein